MNYEQLVKQIKSKNSLLCVGLDTDVLKIPSFLLKEKDPVFEFNKRIIDATIDYAIAYKPNIAFYESEGSKGWESLQKTIEYIPDEVFTIADAKRGDIGNTSRLYARAFFENMNFDSITVAPYMGEDSVTPFLDYKDKWVILLAHTSNVGSLDFQFFEDKKGMKLYNKVVETSQKWTNHERMMYVVGATQAARMAEIRAQAPHHFFLVPGIGAQGGDLKSVCEKGFNSNGGLIINSSRGIIYASNEKDFDKVAKIKSRELKEEIELYLNKLT
ncbi:MAG: orotidine-5'-phosphate decarboxylase [Cyclobacteriaceae bacterium]|nr:orotidine-5'-phosphate decarboxylase [Cyclobacteriaceae bacterium]